MWRIPHVGSTVTWAPAAIVNLQDVICRRSRLIIGNGTKVYKIVMSAENGYHRTKHSLQDVLRN
jgi:hypothetical protein